MDLEQGLKRAISKSQFSTLSPKRPVLDLPPRIVVTVILSVRERGFGMPTRFRCEVGSLDRTMSIMEAERAARAAGHTVHCLLDIIISEVPREIAKGD